jgi:hypothetical protein
MKDNYFEDLESSISNALNTKVQDRTRLLKKDKRCSICYKYSKKAKMIKKSGRLFLILGSFKLFTDFEARLCNDCYKKYFKNKEKSDKR